MSKQNPRRVMVRIDHDGTMILILILNFQNNAFDLTAGEMKLVERTVATLDTAIPLKRRCVSIPPTPFIDSITIGCRGQICLN